MPVIMTVRLEGVIAVDETAITGRNGVILVEMDIARM